MRTAAKTVAKKPDFLVADYGSIVALSPMSAAANQAVADGVIAYEEWQMMGGSIMVDHRLADDSHRKPPGGRVCRRQRVSPSRRSESCERSKCL